jgi:hypothetical protein
MWNSLVNVKFRNFSAFLSIRPLLWRTILRERLVNIPLAGDDIHPVRNVIVDQAQRLRWQRGASCLTLTGTLLYSIYKNP